MAGSLANVKTFVQNTPGAEWWVEELLLRGGRGPNGGVVVGGHCIAGVRYTEPDGDVRIRSFGPYPVSVTPNNAAIKNLVGEVVITQQAQIDAQTTDIAAKNLSISEKTQEIAGLQTSLTASEAAKAAVEESLAEALARIAELEAEEP